MARPGVDPLLLPRIVERAHAAGRRVSVHVETAADFRAAVLAGADFVAHLPGWHVGASTGFADGDLRHWFLDTADGSEAARRNVGVITTTLPKPFLDNSRYGTAMRQVQRANLRTLARAGVRLVIGSDQGDATTPAELRHLASLGALSNLELLRAAVETTPLAIFPERRIGKLADGYEASFLVLRGDPLADIANTTRISMRVKQGQILP